MQYDVFISYRRDGGASTARVLRDRLTEMGYKVFFDVESLRSGYFNEALYSVIDQCKDVLVVLSPNALDRCTSEDDWVRKEVEHALAQNKNVVPVMLRGFDFPEVLPKSIDALRYCNGLVANEDFFDAFMEKLGTFLIAKPAFFHSLMQNRLFKRMIPMILALVVVLCGAWGIKTFLDIQSAAYPRTSAQKNTTSELIYYVSSNLTHFDILAGTYSDALSAAHRYLSSGMGDSTAMNNQFEITRKNLSDADFGAAACTDPLLEKLAGSPFDTAEVKAMHDQLLAFREECLESLTFLEAILDPEEYPKEADRKLEILEGYQTILEENLKAFGYCANQMLLPITQEDALSDFFHETLPYLTHIPLKAVNWSRDEAALQSAINEALNTIQRVLTEQATLVGESSKELAQTEADALQSLLDMGYTEATARRIWEYQTADPTQRKADLITQYISEGYSQEDADSRAANAIQILDIQQQLRIGYAALQQDDADTLWEKMTQLLSVDLFAEALECAQLYQMQTNTSDHYLPALAAFIQFVERDILSGGVMVMDYYTPDGINEVLRIGDIIYGFNDAVIKSYDEYTRQKEALTGDSFTLSVIRVIQAEDGSVEIENLELELTTDMPRVYLNDLIAQD